MLCYIPDQAAIIFKLLELLYISDRVISSSCLCYVDLIFIFIFSTDSLIASLAPCTHHYFLSAPLSLMMGVFLFCGGCELSEFVFVSVILPALCASI